MFVHEQGHISTIKSKIKQNTAAQIAEFWLKMVEFVKLCKKCLKFCDFLNFKEKDLETYA